MAKRVSATSERLVAELEDGRIISVPLEWFPRLAEGSPKELSNWRLIGGGGGIHWPDLDEDISTESLLEGRRSAETSDSLRQWRSRRNGK